MKERIIDFLTRLIPVVTGIAITFTVQGMINRAHSRREVRSALSLVRTELMSNRDDIVYLNQFLDEEQEAARSLVRNAEGLDTLDAEMVRHNLGLIMADVSITLPHDALELLKMSSLFQKIGDNMLSMKVIRAYDTCQILVESINAHTSARDAQTDNLPRWILDHDPRQYTETEDIDAAIKAINAYLRK